MVNLVEVQAESRTRDRVRRAVGERGPVSASALAKELGLTAAAVRRHLDALEHDGVIVEHVPSGGAPRGRGRPARAYVLTAEGQEQFTTAYDGVATAALHYLADTMGEQAVESFADQQVVELEGRLRAAMDRHLTASGADPDDLDARASALAAALSEEGYAASARPVGPGAGPAGIQLCQGHCPVRSVASEFRHFCEAETEAISRILGVHVQRLATLAGGEHVCTTFVPTGALGAREPTPQERARARPYVIPRATPERTGPRSTPTTPTHDHHADERSER
ncbi:metalloregulator ArsR/SmtB family transcription factor [uncultured Ornithinimicrobium sp.]|uniref:helix-turn-helix transcriptional regulator n=1 Tax=uncultured Ornithinimicrobium sp. TaxID=259307 RepID=UPI002591B4B1|nr:helix-turn-helix domain-containing protein [uncultured Ornithinimicrobium sp.]